MRYQDIPFTPAPTVGKIKFTQNWNKKLNSPFFTTIRHWDNQYMKGYNYEIWVNDLFHTRAMVVDKKKMRLEDIPDYTLMLDTGLPPQEARSLIKSIYNHTDLQLEVIMLENLECL